MKEAIHKIAESDATTTAAVAATAAVGIGSLAGILQTWLSIFATAAALILTIFMIRYRLLAIRRLQQDIERHVSTEIDDDAE